MIKLIDVKKRYKVGHSRRNVLNGVNFEVLKGQRVGILGRNGAGKSTLVRIIGGSEMPSDGEILRTMSVSWPLAFSDAFQGSLTGYDNLRFICRVYNVNYQKAKEVVEDFTELGRHLRDPVKSYSSGMGAKFGFGISLAVEFDCFLVDEVLSVGDERFRRKCHFELFERRHDRAMIIVSHDIGIIEEYCNCASVLDKGLMINYSSMEDAVNHYRSA